MNKTLRRFGFSYKKTFHHPKRNQQLRDEFISIKSKIEKDRLVFLELIWH
jgi:hypothetical protein